MDGSNVENWSLVLNHKMRKPVMESMDACLWAWWSSVMADGNLLLIGDSLFTVNRLDGSVPVKYGLRLNMDEKYKALKRELCSLSGIPVEQLLLVEVLGPIVKVRNRSEEKSVWLWHKFLIFMLQ